MNADPNNTLSSYTDAIMALPDECFLGSLLWFSISAADVNLDDARRELEKAGLSTDGMRRILRPVDAFKKAARDVGHKFPAAVDGVKAEFLVRDAGEDSEQQSKHIILERVVRQGTQRHRIVYEKVGELVFTRGVKKAGIYQDYGVSYRRSTNNLQSPLTPAEDQWLTEALDSFQSRFDHLLHFMDSHAVRSFVREYFARRLSGTLVKESGGVYFVGQKHAAEVAALGRWIKHIGSDFRAVPLLNLEDGRQMIMEAFEDEIVREVERLMDELAKILKDPDRQIEEKTFDAHGLRAAELTEKVAEYNSMLGARADRAAIEISNYSRQVMALGNRIRSSRTTTAKTIPIRRAG